MIYQLQSNNYMDIHLKDDLERPLVLIAPGGGYQRTSPREAMPIANLFMAHGYHTAIIYYRETLLKHPACIEELVGFYQHLVENLSLPIKNRDIILMGFSSGGHYMANLGVSYHQYGLKKPKAMILSYPVITGKKGFAHEDSIKRLYGNKSAASRKDFAIELKVSTHTPPTFLWHTVDDQAVPVENSVLCFQALKKQNVLVDLHLYHKGVHGISLGTKDVIRDINEDPNQYDLDNKHNQTWFSLVISFLNQIKA
ncbi:MAG: acetylesterase, partial [Tenericutes bacterium HGW-Tenericutes-8]